MPLPVNSRLGPYEIKSPLGAGGMGEVYRARDSRLNRDVAIKILRTDTLRTDGAGTADLRTRFEREARAVAALNHPNIVAVYDFGIEADQQYIVSELIEGESLRALMRGKVVPARKLVDIAAQIADGLAAAHAAEIVHRDLKPENIMIAKDGRVKILDFGLARQARPSGMLSPTGSQDETIAGTPEHSEITGEGVVIGTPNYMSPEQALGHELDYSSDQFSFGLILYELASGKQAFAKTSTIETMAAIVREEPAPMDEKLPPPLRWIIDRCLAKEPDQRYESTRDLYRDLKNLRDHFSEAYSSGAFPQVAAPLAKTSYKRLVAIGSACIILSALLVYVLKPSGQNVGDLRYTPFASNASSGFWSPDGRTVAYASDVEGTRQVFLKSLNSPVATQLTHEKADIFPIGWSDEGSHIVTFERGKGFGGKFYSLATVGGEPEFLIDGGGFAFALSADGKTLAEYWTTRQGLLGVNISDPLGSPFVSYNPAPFAAKEVETNPVINFSPDGHSLLLLLKGDDGKQAAWLLPYPANSKTPKHILPKLETIDSQPGAEWMPDNRHLVISVSMQPGGRSHLWMADILSNELDSITNGTANEAAPHVSRDGRNLLFTEFNESSDVISLSVSDGSVKTLISTGRNESMASLAAKRNEMTWVTDRSGSSEIWLRSEDGSERQIVTSQDSPGSQLANPALSPNGDRIIFEKREPSGAAHLWITSVSGSAPIRLTNDQTAVEDGGSWSPDGKRFAYSIFGGDRKLRIARTSGAAVPMVLRDETFYLPTWSLDGKWIVCDWDKGWSLVSSEGNSTRLLGEFRTRNLVFSNDGRALYGIQTADPKTGRDSATLFSLDPMTLKQTIIKELGVDYQPKLDSTRFSMASDGKSFVYSTTKTRQEIWLLQGFKQPTWLDQFAFR